MEKIFINFRKSDEPFAAALLDARLCERFGEDRVFRDSRSIPAGVDFERELWGTLARSPALVVVIGPRWLDLGPGDRRYVDSPDDYARREIAYALQGALRVLPVLVNDAPTLTAGDLPADIAALANQQYLRLSPRNVEYDLRRITDELAAILRSRAPAAATGTVMGIEADGEDPAAAGDAVRAAVTRGHLAGRVVVRERERGAVVLAADPVAPILLVSELVPALQAQAGPGARIRVAVAHGSYVDGTGLSGSAVEAVDRLLAAPGLPQVFAADPEVRVALAVTERYYREAVVRAHTGPDASTFARFPLGAGDTGEVGWLHVPGRTAPPVPAFPPPDRGPSEPPRPASTITRSNINHGNVGGDQVYIAGDSVGHDKHVYHGWPTR